MEPDDEPDTNKSTQHKYRLIHRYPPILAVSHRIVFIFSFTEDTSLKKVNDPLKKQIERRHE